MYSNYCINLTEYEWNQLYNQLSAPERERARRINDYNSSLEAAIQTREVNDGFAISSSKLDFSGIRDALKNRLINGNLPKEFVRDIPNCDYTLVKSNEPAFEITTKKTSYSKLFLQSAKTKRYNNLESSSLNVA